MPVGVPGVERGGAVEGVGVGVAEITAGQCLIEVRQWGVGRGGGVRDEIADGAGGVHPLADQGEAAGAAHHPGIRSADAGESVQEGGLAGAVLADDEQAVTCGDRDVDAGEQRPVGDGDTEGGRGQMRGTGHGGLQKSSGAGQHETAARLHDGDVGRKTAEKKFVC